MGKRGEQLQAEYSCTYLQYGPVRQRRVCPDSPAGNRDAVNQYFTADPGPDQQAGAVLPGKIQMLGTDTGAGDNQVTGAQGSENALPGHRKPGILPQFIAAGQNNQFSDIARTGQVFKTLPAFFFSE